MHGTLAKMASSTLWICPLSPLTGRMIDLPPKAKSMTDNGDDKSGARGCRFRRGSKQIPWFLIRRRYAHKTAQNTSIAFDPVCVRQGGAQ